MDWCYKGEEKTRGTWKFEVDEPLARALEKISLGQAKIIGKWLEDCVKTWCPKAATAFSEHDFCEVRKQLEWQGFSLAIYPDHYEFLEHGVPLAKCSVVVRFDGFSPGKIDENEIL